MKLKLSPQTLTIWADSECQHDSRFTRLAHLCTRVILISVQEFKRNELSLRASALTFTVLLSLVPVLAMSTALVKGLGGGDQLKQVVYSYVQSLDRGQSSTPPSMVGDPLEQEQPADPVEQQAASDLTQHLFSALDRIFNYVERTNFATLGTIGVAGLFVSVILVLSNIEMAMNAIWRVASGRSIMRKIADYLALIILMPLSLNIGLFASTILKSEALLSKFTILLPMVWIQAVILKFVPVFFIALTLYVIYLFFPNTRVKTLPAVIGAAFAGYFWFEVQNIYIGLQVGVSNYNAIYGSFATLPLFLVWIYFGWIFILLGAQIAFACQNHETFRLVDSDAPPSLRLAVAYDMLEYIRENFENELPATADDFLRHYPMHNKNLVEEIIDQLVAYGLIHHTENSSTMMPSIPKDKLNHNKIVQAVLGATFSDTDGGKTSSMILQAAAESVTVARQNNDR